MKTVSVFAPGKLMLLGEHAVIYNRPCLATAIDKYLKLETNLLSENIIVIDAPQVDIHNYRRTINHPIKLNQVPRGVRFIEAAINRFSAVRPITHGLRLTISSEFQTTFGFGSSSAVTVCTIRALSKTFNIPLSSKQVFDLTYQAVIDVQGVSSGFDIATAVYGGTLYFVTSGQTIEPLDISQLPLVIGYTGIKADTATMVKQVAQLKQQKPDVIDAIFDDITNLVNQARQALETNNYGQLGKLMNRNQELLTQLKVSTPELDKLITAARNAGAYGAKLSGAGGGDCMIALASPNSRRSVAQAIKQAGGQVINVHTHASII